MEPSTRGGSAGHTHPDSLDLQTDHKRRPYDPSDIDYRVWLAWHGATQRIYVAVERADDIYNNEYEYDGTLSSCISMMKHDASAEFRVDGDGSGGKHQFFGNEIDDYEEHRLLTQHAQQYFVLGAIFGSDPMYTCPIRVHLTTKNGFNSRRMRRKVGLLWAPSPHFR